MKTIEERFWPKVDVRGPDECWPWMASTDQRGYGSIVRTNWREGSTRAPRVSWELENGSIPEGLCVLHHCDNPGCVNPKHLFLGTQSDNVLDMDIKGRRANKNGELNGRSKLTEDQVISIRKEYSQENTSHPKLGRKYGVGHNTIGRAIRRESWRNI